MSPPTPNLELVLPVAAALLGAGVVLSLVGVPRRFFQPSPIFKMHGQCAACACGSCCPTCGYSRVGAESELCPECGEEFSLAATDRSRRFRLRIAGALALTLFIVGLASITPRSFDRGYVSASPSIVLAGAMVMLPYEAESCANELLMRADAGELNALDRFIIAEAVAFASESSGPDTRTAMMRLVSRIDTVDPAPCGLVLTGLRDTDARVRLASVEAASRCTINDEALHAAVLNLARADENERVRAAAAETGWRLWSGRPGMAGRLAATITDPSDKVRQRVMYAVGAGTSDEPWVLDAIEERLADPEEEVRTAAAFALGRLVAQGRADAARLTRHTASPSPAVRCAAIRGIGDAGFRGIPLRARLVDLVFLDDFAEVRAAATDALKAICISTIH
jgi:uncharacterized protein (DUF983 family)